MRYYQTWDQALGGQMRGLPGCARARLHLDRFSVSRLTPRKRRTLPYWAVPADRDLIGSSD